MFLTPQRNFIPWAWGDFLRDGHLKCPSADLQVPSIAFIPKLQEFAPKTGSQVDHLRSESAFTFACFFFVLCSLVLLVLLQKVDPMAVCLRMIRPRKEMKKGEDDAATIGMRQVCDNMFS